MFFKISAKCPVCIEHIGFIERGEIASLTCKECQWIFTWDNKGKLLAPIKVHPIKDNKCDCEGCHWRKEKKH